MSNMPRALKHTFKALINAPRKNSLKKPHHSARDQEWLAFFRLQLCLLIGLSLLIFSSSWANPWLTGPLLAPAGIVVPNGHSNLETYALYTDDEGAFDRAHHIVQTVNRGNGSTAMPIFTHGLAPNFDITYVTSYIFNHSGRYSQELGDVVGILGYQAFKQETSKWRPSLRVVLAETVPIGRFEQLNESFNGQDVTGIGGYRTGIGFNFEHLLTISDPFYLRTRLSLTYFIPHPVSVRGRSAFGGTPTTEGTVLPGQSFTVDVAGELTLTKNWVVVMEAIYFNAGASKFNGFLGRSTNSRPARIGRPSSDELALVPAIEFNFTQRLGIIAGVWFPLQGRSAPNFTTYVAALNVYF